MIISGASFLCWPHPVWVGCENNRYCGYFIPTSRRNLVPHRLKGEWGNSSHTCGILNCPSTSGVWTCSKLSNGWILHVNTYEVHCQNLGKCTSSSVPSSVDPSLCPLLAPSLQLLISTLSVLSHFISSCTAPSLCPHGVHLSDPVTLAARRQIARKPTDLNITLLSAFTVHQQTWKIAGCIQTDINT